MAYIHDYLFFQQIFLISHNKFIDHSERDSSNEEVNEEKEDVKESSEGIINHVHVLPKYSVNQCT